MIGSLQAQNVGIGTTTPQSRLHIVAPSGYTFPLLQIGMDGSASPYLIIQPDGKVGIGIANPTEALDVSGNVRFSGALMPGGDAGTAGFVLMSQGSGNPPVWVDTALLKDNWGSQVAVTQSPIVGDGTGSNPIGLQGGTNTGDILIWDGTQWVIKPSPFDSVCNIVMTNYLQKWTGSELCNSIIYDDGTNVGVGTTTPTQKLDVAGNVQFSGALMPAGNPGLPGQVLTSNGPGTAPSWTTFSTGGSGITGCANCPTILGPPVDANGDSAACYGPPMTWGQCAEACRKSTYRGFTDWRMPTFNEILYLTLVYDPLYCPNGNFWTATPFQYNGYHPDVHNTTYSTSWTGGSQNYYMFNPSDGLWHWDNGPGNNNPTCRCVR